MSDDKKKTGSPDNKRIDIHDPSELRDWAKSIGTTPEKIKEAVKEVGTSAEKVKEHIKKK